MVFLREIATKKAGFAYLAYDVRLAVRGSLRAAFFTS